MRRFLLAMMLFSAMNAVVAQQANPLSLPDTLSGTTISLTLQSDSTQFLPGAKSKTYGINQSYLAPTIMLRRNQAVQMQVTNSLADTTTMHWHGLHVAAANDGGPHAPIAPGATWSPAFTVLDEASTYWYHPHLHMHTAEQVYFGAAGMIIVHDSLERALGLPGTYGVDDFPMILQDKSFDSLSNQLIYEAISDTMMINGTLNPYLNVPAQMVRFRFLNASNQRVYNLGLPLGISFMIASDGGLLERPLPVTRILLAPGERVEVVVDFSNITNNLPLISFNSEMGPGISGGPQGPGGGPGNPLDGADFPICEFRVQPATANPVTSLPSTFRSYDIPNPLNADVVRIKVFDTATTAFPFYINTTPYDMNVNNDTVHLNDVEVWELYNQTTVAHPFHIHDIQFYIFEMNGQTPMQHLGGRKDVVLSQPGDVIKFVTRFDDFADAHTPYMYHCHNLFHEDAGMMGQFIVLDSLHTGQAKPSGQRADFLLRAYPNPTAGKVKVAIEENNGQRLRAMELCDLRGRRLLELPVLNGSMVQEVDLSSLAAGMYLLRVISHSGAQAVIRVERN